MSSRSRVELESWLSSIEPVGEILDIGGSQNPIVGRVKNLNSSRVFIMDLPEPHEVKRSPHIICNIEKPLEDNVMNMYEWRFDTVFCIEVSEYWINPLKALKNINDLMKLQGELYISFHTLYMLHPPEGEDSLRYTLNGIIRLMEESGFEIQTVNPRTLTAESKEMLAKIYRKEGMRGTYNDPNAYHEGYLIKAIKSFK